VIEKRIPEKVNAQFYREIDELEAEKKACGGEVLDGLVVALDRFNEHCGTKKYKKRLFLLTDGDSMCSAKKNEIMSLIGQMNEHDIKLNVIALDFADDLAEDEDEGPKDSSEDEDGKPDKKGGKVQNLTENQKKTREFLD